MKKTTSIIQLLLCLTAGAFAADTVRVEVLRNSRKIMHDGFLMEWSITNASVWGRDSAWRYDAMATPEGLAGYIQLLRPQGCREIELDIMADSTARERISLPPDTLQNGRFWKVDRSMFASDSTYTIEWLVPWPENHHPVKTPFTVQLQERCLGKPMLPVLQFTYPYNKKKSGQTGGLIGRVLIIGILGALYLTVQAKIRSQSRRRESPHQSA